MALLARFLCFSVVYPMALVSLQGTSLSRGQRERLEQQQHVRSFMNPALAQSVEVTLQAVQALKDNGVKPERVWFVDRQEKGTISIAEWMGY